MQRLARRFAHAQRNRLLAFCALAIFPNIGLNCQRLGKCIRSRRLRFTRLRHKAAKQFAQVARQFGGVRKKQIHGEGFGRFSILRLHASEPRPVSVLRFESIQVQAIVLIVNGFLHGRLVDFWKGLVQQAQLFPIQQAFGQVTQELGLARRGVVG